MSKPIIDINGVLREMTDAEYTAYLASRDQQPELTSDEKLEAMATNVNDMMLAIMYLSIE